MSYICLQSARFLVLDRRMTEAWSQLGAAVRTAQAIGLHRDGADMVGDLTFRVKKQAHQERRAWNSYKWNVVVVYGQFLLLYIARPFIRFSPGRIFITPIDLSRWSLDAPSPYMTVTPRHDHPRTQTRNLLVSSTSRAFRYRSPHALLSSS